MRKKTLWFTVTAALLLPLAGRAPAAQTQTFYVAPTGDDEADRRARAWPGYHTERHPVDVRH